MDKPSSGDPERRWSRSGTPLFTRKERAEMEKYLDFRYGVVSVRRRRRKWREYLSPVV